MQIDDKTFENVKVAAVVVRRKVLLFSGLLVLLLVLFGIDIIRSQVRQADTSTSTHVTSSKSTRKSVQTPKKNERILIVFFSRSGTNYPNVTLKVGHTHRVANEIARVTGGTKYEIVPTRAYPKNYDATVDQAEREQERNARPKIKGPLPDVSRYDTIFFGYPIWWNDVPMPVRTFMDQVDLNGKTLIPFSTNEGSGWGDSLSTLHHQYPRAKIRKGFEIQGQKADRAQRQIDAWLHGLGY